MYEQIYQNPTIYAIPIPLPNNPLRNLNCYIISSQGENLIIDTGFHREECRKALFESLNELAIDLSHTRLFLTHLHSDHAGLAEYLTEKGVQAYMNAIDYEVLRSSLDGSKWVKDDAKFSAEGMPTEEIAKQSTNNQALLYRSEYLFPATMIHHGDVLTVGDVTLRCIHTPGHTPGHTCLYCEKHEILFAGDHILFDITPNISIWNDVPSSLQDYMDSLQEVSRLKVSHTFPAHRSANGDLYARADALIHHHHQRLREVLNAVYTNPACTAYETAARITWSIRAKSWEDFPSTQKWFAMGETLSHLKWLVDHGQIRQREDFRYEALCQPSDLTF